MLNTDLTTTTEVPLEVRPGLLLDDAMSEAGRKILLHQFEVMLKHEPGARSGQDDDAIHDMRVATRRMRSALQIFGGFYKKSSMAPVFSKSLKRIAAALGDVRDLDVFRAKLKDYAEALPTDARSGLDSFRERLKADEARARLALVETLDGQRYAHFVGTLRAFVNTPGAGAQPHETHQPYQVQHVASRLIYDRYTAIRAFEPALADASLETLHDLRIEGKQLRYTLEFFTEVLAPESAIAITAVKALQDHLGALQDARVAIERIQTHLTQADSREDMTVVVRYLAVREEEKQTLLNGVPAAWEDFTNRKVRRALALAVAAL